MRQEKVSTVVRKPRLLGVSSRPTLTLPPPQVEESTEPFSLAGAPPRRLLVPVGVTSPGEAGLPGAAPTPRPFGATEPPGTVASAGLRPPAEEEVPFPNHRRQSP